MVKISVKLLDGSSAPVSVHAIAHSVLLSTNISLEEESEDIEIPIQLTSKEWNYFKQFVNEIAKLEKDTGKRFRPNQEFAADYARVLPDYLPRVFCLVGIARIHACIVRAQQWCQDNSSQA